MRHAATILKSLSVAAFLVTGLIASVTRPVRATEDEETVPVMCPQTIPAPNWTAASVTWFRVPQATWDPNHGNGGGWVGLPNQTVPGFAVSSWTYTTNIQNVLPGQAWYIPGQTGPVPYNGHSYMWEGPGGSAPPGAWAECRKVLGFFSYIYFPGDVNHIYGYAFRLGNDDDNGDQGCGGGGGDDDPIGQTSIGAKGAADAGMRVLDCGGGSGGSDPAYDCWDDYIVIQVQLEGDPTWYTLWEGYATVCEYME